MKKLLLLSCFLLISCSVEKPVSLDANEVGGGDFDVSDVTSANENLLTYVDLCLGAKSCVLSPDEATALNKIRNELLIGRSPLEPLRTNDPKYKDYFREETLHSVMATTPDVLLAPIAVNVPELAEKRHEAKIAGLLVHEYGHHHGYEDHEWLANLGTKVEKMLEKRYESKALPAPYSAKLVTVALNPFSEVSLRMGDTVTPLTEILRAKIGCNFMETEEERAKNLKGFTLHSLREGYRVERRSVLKFSFLGNVKRKCGGLTLSEEEDEIGPEYEFQFEARQTNGVWKLEPKVRALPTEVEPPR